MAVSFFYEEIKYKISSESTIKSLIDIIIKNEGKLIGEINYSFISDESLLEINKKFLNHNYFTDIITFNYSLVNIINGDIYISFDTVQSNSEKFKSTFINEMYRVIIHGIIHLCGYNDNTDLEKKVMRKKENQYLTYLGKI